MLCRVALSLGDHRDDPTNRSRSVEAIALVGTGGIVATGHARICQARLKKALASSSKKR